MKSASAFHFLMPTTDLFQGFLKVLNRVQGLRHCEMNTVSLTWLFVRITVQTQLGCFTWNLFL